MITFFFFNSKHDHGELKRWMDLWIKVLCTEVDHLSSWTHIVEKENQFLCVL